MRCSFLAAREAIHGSKPPVIARCRFCLGCRVACAKVQPTVPDWGPTVQAVPDWDPKCRPRIQATNRSAPPVCLGCRFGCLPFLATPDHPMALAEPRDAWWKFVEPFHPCTTSWNPRGLVEPLQNPCRTLVQPCETLPQGSPDHPAALAEPCGTVVEPNPRGTFLTQGRPGAYPQSFQLLGKNPRFKPPWRQTEPCPGCPTSTGSAFCTWH